MDNDNSACFIADSEFAIDFWIDWDKSSHTNTDMGCLFNHYRYFIASI